MTNEVVVTGIGMISPVGNNINNSWENLINGNSGIDYIKSFDPEGLETQIAGEVKNFDPVEIIGKKESRRMDRFSQLAMAASYEAMESADLKINDSNQNKISVARSVV